MTTSSATVYCNDKVAGQLTELEHGFLFQYEVHYLVDSAARAISLTLPLSQTTHQSPYLFPFFVGLLPEGYNRNVQCQPLKLDESDDFGLLLAVSRTDTIGAVRVVEQSSSV